MHPPLHNYSYNRFFVQAKSTHFAYLDIEWLRARQGDKSC